jgi:large subunit ribosomal protein L13
MAQPTDASTKWWIVDAEGKVLGRMAREIAVRLMGKHRPTYTPHVESGDFVVVVNVEKIRLTGNKWENKEYRWYTGYPGQKTETIGSRFAKEPDVILTEAVRRMLPKNKLASKMLARLKVYAGPDHPHQAQNPEAIELT